MDPTKLKNTNSILFSRLCNISGTIDRTEMVNRSKFAVFYKENCQKTFKTALDSKYERPIQDFFVILPSSRLLKKGSRQIRGPKDKKPWPNGRSPIWSLVMHMPP